MSRVHDALRRIEHRGATESRANSAMSSLVKALIEEVADEVPDDPRLETVRIDLLAACEAGDQTEFGLRFYLSIRSLLRAYSSLQERIKAAEASALTQPLGSAASAD